MVQMMRGYGGMGLLGGILGLIFFLAVLVGLVLLVIWAVRRLRQGSMSTPPQVMGAPTAKEILQARYAKGEITREQYLEMLKDLSI
jgi:putative membrane protein